MMHFDSPSLYACGWARLCIGTLRTDITSRRRWPRGFDCRNSFFKNRLDNYTLGGQREGMETNLAAQKPSSDTHLMERSPSTRRALAPVMTSPVLGGDGIGCGRGGLDINSIGPKVLYGIGWQSAWWRLRGIQYWCGAGDQRLKNRFGRRPPARTQAMMPALFVGMRAG